LQSPERKTADRHAARTVNHPPGAHIVGEILI
jgi:hypothetical protein